MHLDNEATVNVSKQYIDDTPIIIRVRQISDRIDPGFGTRPRYAYEVEHEGRVVISGDDLCGPANGLHPEADEMAYTVACFLSASTGEDFRDEYTGEQLDWLEMHGERLGNFSMERDEETGV